MKVADDFNNDDKNKEEKELKVEDNVNEKEEDGSKVAEDEEEKKGNDKAEEEDVKETEQVSPSKCRRKWFS